MSWRRFVRIGTVVFTAVMCLMLGTTNFAHAAPKVTYGKPTEGSKVILDELSIDGPAIAVTYSPQTIIAWTGTDPNHLLNIMTSSDGLHYSNKHILPENSLWRPAVAYIDSGRGAPYGTIVLAWTGTDPNHTLNVEFISTPDFNVTRKITFWGENSFTAPALATINGDIRSDIYLSWAGTDPGHTVNVMHLSTDSDQTDKTILWGWNSLSRPNLSTDPSVSASNALILSWTGTNHRIYFATSTDKIHWNMPNTSPLSIQTDWAPSMIGIATTSQPGLHWLAWAGNGTSPTGNINLQYTQHYPTWSDANATTSLDESAISSLALAVYGDGPTHDVLIAWTGTDNYHHLNVAVITI